MLRYQYVTLTFQGSERTAELTITAPDTCAQTADEALARGSDWWVVRAWREFDDALLNLRLTYRDNAWSAARRRQRSRAAPYRRAARRRRQLVHHRSPPPGQARAQAPRHDRA
ncbi:MAG: hypothetical protein R3E96_10640 [Planctomycetota bacterium]